MSWVITQSGNAINLDRMAELWFEDGTGRDYEPISVLKASEPARLEDVDGDDRVFAVSHEVCVVLGSSDYATPLIRALLAAIREGPFVEIADVVEEAGFMLWHHMDHHP